MSDDESEQPILNIGTYTGPRNELGERHGRGRCIFPNKDVYVGDYEKGLRHGHGTYRWAYLGVKYKGEYKNGRRNGFGTMTYTNGTVYEGNWVNDRREGTGRITYPNLDYYSGEFHGGLPHGQGEYYYKSCDVKVRGTFEYGRITFGEMILRDGSRYEGAFRLNQPFGKGSWTINGWKQEGCYIEINPPPKEADELEEDGQGDEEGGEDEPQEGEEEEVDPNDPEKSVPEEGEEEVPEGEAPGADRNLQNLLPPKRKRKTIKLECPKLEPLRTLKLKWVPSGLPTATMEPQPR
ncbi:putative Phosphatidylinositol-4-phosphate 5-kinase [Giardia muris]|uniref:Putative Phosphatidylinositol-4-phosphate 5-kinase n=1 Tax=Giardia muris TaxID=5742 RepID=A0A4Z1SX52_GIAMU|nr:putative Phosphatidylinositol-4-phosphate 5-kinase [Giardia muris]|eukprot:TNJ30120.1 putative Phosphatidylinositol-4-phosphate 5-kinase [Giardia muris]